MLLFKLSLVAHASAAVVIPDLWSTSDSHQHPIANDLEAADFKCDLPPVISPSGGLPSANELFSSDEALETQVQRHSAIVRVPSICYDDLGDFDEDERWFPFYELRKVLADTFPAVHARTTLEKVNTFGLVYTIEGSDSSLKPLLLTAHQDVVPVADASTWTHPPFSAFFDGQWLWGRGSSDDKNSLTALLSALETLLSDNNWTPKRTIILAFGFDEECSGNRGAGFIAKHLEAKYGNDGIAMILDEGGMGLQLIGNDTLYALPAVMEKGHVDIWFELHVQGGHSSIPFPHTGIGIISEIVVALEAHPYKAQLLKGSPIYNHFVCQARYSPDAQPRITKLLKKGDLHTLTKELVSLDLSTHFRLQTSQSVDTIEGGQKINAMPEVVKLGVNYRVAPQNSIPEIQHNVVRYIRKIAKKFKLTINAFEGDVEYEAYAAAAAAAAAAEDDLDIYDEVSQRDSIRPLYEVDYNGTLVLSASQKTYVAPISPSSGPIWDVFSGTIQHSFAFDGGVVVPVGELMTGNTDTRHYLNLSKHVYRWTPVRTDSRANIHTIDERIDMLSHIEMLKFYYDLIRNFDAADV